ERPPLPCPPHALWARLPPVLHHQIVDDLAAIWHEVIHDDVRTPHAAAPGGDSADRCAPVDAAASPVPPREPAAPLCPRAARRQSRLASGGRGRRRRRCRPDRHRGRAPRGIPRPGKALLHGIVYCGECGHKLVGQYKGGAQYVCTYLRGQYGVPVCPRIPADPVADAVVEAFFAALSPVELDTYARALATAQARDERVEHAQQQHLERLR